MDKSPSRPPQRGEKPLTQIVSFQGQNDTEKGKISIQDSDHDALGYKQELKRNLSMLTALGLGASIIAAPLGLCTSASFALINGGTITYFFGWLLLSLISICIAASLGEIASVYPTSGGVYVWTAHLAPKRFSSISSFIIGWVSLVANLLLCLSIAFGEAQLIMAAISLFRDNQWAPESWHVVLMHFAIMIVSCWINAWGIRGNLLESINTFSIYWTGATAIIICIVVLAMSNDKRTAQEVFGQWKNASGWTDGWSFFVGLLTPAYVLTGYGTLCYLADEVCNPQQAVPRAMVGCVFAASLTGFIFIIPLSFVFPKDLSVILNTAAGQPLPAAFSIATQSAGGAFGLLFLILIIGLMASIGSLTVASRCFWSFSRDNGVPLARIWSKVDKFHQMPLNALIMVTIIISLLGCIYLGNSGAFNAFTGAATILLGISYVTCVAMSLFDGRKQMVGAPWSLGRAGYAINSVALVWVLFSIILFCFPTTKEVDASSMNYASVVVVFFTCVATIWYFVAARRLYKVSKAIKYLIALSIH